MIHVLIFLFSVPDQILSQLEVPSVININITHNNAELLIYNFKLNNKQI